MAKIYSLILILVGLFALPFLTQAATLSVSPAQGTFEVGDRVTVKVLVSGDQPLNAISSTISVSSDIFSVEAVSKVGSVLNFWVAEPTINNADGSIRFEGVSLTGFQGSAGVVLAVTLRATKVGTGSISFLNTQILANDGQGTNITGNVTGGSFSIIPPKPAPVIPTLEPIPTAPPAVTEESSATTTIETEPVQPAPSLKAPKIILGTKYNAPAVIGLSEYPRAKIVLTFVTKFNTKIFINGTADETGVFAILLPTALKSGSYTVQAIAIQADGTNSLPSNQLVVSVGSIASDIDWSLWLAVALGVLALGVLAKVVLNMSHRRLPADVNADMAAVDDAVKQYFDMLRDDLAEFEGQIDLKGRAMTGPRGKLAFLKKDLNDIEIAIRTDIKNIGS